MDAQEGNNMAGSKKEINIFHEWNDALYQMKFIGGGQLPEALKGKFTSIKEAEKMRDLYYAGRLPKRTQTIQSVAEEKKSAQVAK